MFLLAYSLGREISEKISETFFSQTYDVPYFFLSQILFISYNQYDILFLLFSYHKDTELYLLLCRFKRQVLSFRGSIPNAEKPSFSLTLLIFVWSTLANPDAERTCDILEQSFEYARVRIGGS